MTAKIKCKTVKKINLALNKPFTRLAIAASQMTDFTIKFCTCSWKW